MGDLMPCPFCGATPHQGLGKVWYDQLHGDPHQDFSIWCPHHCARITRGERNAAITAWNTRVAQNGFDPIIPRECRVTAEMARLTPELRHFFWNYSRWIDRYHGGDDMHTALEPHPKHPEPEDAPDA